VLVWATESIAITILLKSAIRKRLSLGSEVEAQRILYLSFFHHSSNNYIFSFHNLRFQDRHYFKRHPRHVCEQDRHSLLGSPSIPGETGVHVFVLVSNRLPKLGSKQYLCWSFPPPPKSLGELTFNNSCILLMSEPQDNSVHQTQLCLAGVFVSVPDEKCKGRKNR